MSWNFTFANFFADFTGDKKRPSVRRKEAVDSRFSDDIAKAGSQLGSATTISFNSGSFIITNASSKPTEIQNLQNLNTLLSSFWSDEFSAPKVDRVTVRIDAYSAQHQFKLVPFVVMCESGVTFTSPTESTSEQPAEVIADAVDKNFHPWILDTIVPRFIRNNSENIWIAANYEVDITKAVDAFFRRVNRLELESGSIPVLIFGMIAYQPDDGVATTFYYNIDVFAHTKLRSNNRPNR